MNVIEFRNGAYETPWGHRFRTKAERDAFIEGMKCMADNIDVTASQLIEGINIRMAQERS